MKWTKTRLIEVSSSIQTGPFGSQLHESDYSDEGTPVIMPKDIVNGGVSESDIARVSKAHVDRLKRHKVCTGDIIYSRRGDVGRCAYISNKEQGWLCGTGCLKVTVDKSKANPKFVFYQLQRKDSVAWVENHAVGSTMPNLNTGILERVPITFPSLDLQNNIASILEQYDSLIELNNKRIKLLEQMAENLYKHSFSSEKVEGCSEQRKLKEVISIIRGVSYSSEEIECEDGNALINLKNIQGFGGFRADGTKRYSGKYKKEQVVKTGDLVMGVTDVTQDRRTVGAVALLPILKETSVISADLIKIESDIDNIFLYSMFRFGKVSSYIAQFANGANVLHLRPQSIESIKVYIPPKDMIDRFVSVVKPMVEEINQLNESNENLIKQRDLLLPRLMSGKLEV